MSRSWNWTRDPYADVGFKPFDIRTELADAAKEEIENTENFRDSVNVLEAARQARISIYRELGRSWAGLRLDDVGILWLDIDQPASVCWPGADEILDEKVINVIQSSAQDAVENFDSPTDAVAFYLELAITCRINDYERDKGRGIRISLAKFTR